MLQAVIDSIVTVVGDLGYTGIVIMMFLESTFFPFPSEVVMIPAGYLAAKGEMNIYMVIFLGVLGSILGALFNFLLALKFGRMAVLKFGRYFLFKECTLEKMERFFVKHGAMSTFVGRLLPGIRQYISLPAGLAKMNIVTFSIFTALGAGIWSTVLALLGYFIGGSQDLISRYMHEILLWGGVGLLALVVAYTMWHRRSNRDK